MSKSLRNYTLRADKQISITYQKQLLKALTQDIGGIKAVVTILEELEFTAIYH